MRTTKKFCMFNVVQPEPEQALDITVSFVSVKSNLIKLHFSYLFILDKKMGTKSLTGLCIRDIFRNESSLVSWCHRLHFLKTSFMTSISVDDVIWRTIEVKRILWHSSIGSDAMQHIKVQYLESSYQLHFISILILKELFSC